MKLLTNRHQAAVRVMLNWRLRKRLPRLAKLADEILSQGNKNSVERFIPSTEELRKIPKGY